MKLFNAKKFFSIKYLIQFSFVSVYIFSIVIILAFISYKIIYNSKFYRDNLLNKDSILLNYYCYNYLRNHYEDINEKYYDLLTKDLKKFFQNDNYIHHIIIYDRNGGELMALYNFTAATAVKYANSFEHLKEYSVSNNIFEQHNAVIKISNVRNRKDNKLLGFIQIGYSKKYFNKLILNSVMFALFIAIPLIAASLIILNKIINHIINPIQRLAKIARRISEEEEMPESVEIRSNNEVGDLALAFNHMIKDLKQRIKYLQSIQILGIEISVELNKDELLKNIIKIYTKNSNCKKCALLLTGEKKNTIELASGLNLIKSKFIVKYSEGLTGSVAVSCNYRHIDNIGEFPEYIMFYSPEELEGIKNKQALAIPLVVQDRLAGVICLTGREDDSNFEIPEIIFYQTLASTAAIAIDNATLYELAITDGLTKIYIHRYFQIKLEEEIEYHSKTGKELCLMMLDIDHFKSFNDTYGHQQGDIVLQHLAAVLKQSTRVIDVRQSERRSDIVARYGGEEFSVILPLTDLQGAVTVAERIRTNIQNYDFPGQDKPLKVTVSIGLADYKIGMKREQLIKYADNALYESKKNGRNRVSIYKDKG